MNPQQPSTNREQAADNRERQSDFTIQKQLAEVCARFADICDYFSRQNVDLPSDVLEEISRVSKLSVPDRIVVMDRFNRNLMEYLHAVGPDSGIRH